MTIETDDYTEAMLGLANALNEWRDAGADTLVLVGAIQKFIWAINDNQHATIAEATFRAASREGTNPNGRTSTLPSENSGPNTNNGT